MKRGLLILSLAAAAGLAGAQAPAPAPATNAAPNPNAGLLRAQLVTAQREMDVFLLERKGESLFYRPPNVPAGVMAQLRFADVQEANFVIDYDEVAVFNAVREKKWTTAAQLILTPVTPALPFLDLPGNSACAAVMEAARYLVQGGRAFQKAGGEANLKYASQRFGQARELFDRVAAVTWYPDGAEAKLRSVQCLQDLGQADEAAAALDRMLVPEPSSPEFGLYWLTKANLSYAAKDLPTAVDAAARSLAFQNKDMETFVEASMLSARCYEDLLEMHRARDVYYEMARLFGGTEAGDRARARLEHIMRNGLTKEKEAANVAKVFFGSEEDMDALAEQFLSGKAGAQPEASDSKGETKP
jgi:tetratricopeptide (TPR) repeat protein